MAALAESSAMISRLTTAVARAAQGAGVRLVDSVPREVVDDIFGHALKKQTGVSLKYMLDFGSKPIERQLILSAQFLHKELPVRLAHRVAELENLPYGLSTKPHVTKVGVYFFRRGWWCCCFVWVFITHVCAYPCTHSSCVLVDVFTTQLSTTPLPGARLVCRVV